MLLVVNLECLLDIRRLGDAVTDVPVLGDPDVGDVIAIAAVIQRFVVVVGCNLTKSLGQLVE